jgi:hypothetical protein
MRDGFSNIQVAIDWSISRLKASHSVVDAGHWQGVPTKGAPDLMTKEILDLSWGAPMPMTPAGLSAVTQANQPWAEREFQERVGGEPHNPHDSLPDWPWWHGQADATMTQGKFTHTYSERFWPKQAAEGEDPLCRRCGAGAMPGYHRNYGIRYPYGDYGDVVDLLAREPHTRQAYLPIFFPEDTGAVHGGRIPCSLGYHFLLRQGSLHLWYEIRSCDAVRHFRDDIYLAVRLAQHTLAELIRRSPDEEPGQGVWWPAVDLGNLYFTAHSFHVHMGDYHPMDQ